MNLNTTSKSSNLMADVDAKTRMAGANKFEALTFSLGKRDGADQEELFGINVFKVKEVIKAPPITAAPGMPHSVKGLVSLRGVLVPVVDLAEYAGFPPSGSDAIMILTEYNRQTQGFLVKSVDTILRISWEDMKVPPTMINQSALGGLVTSVTHLESGVLAMMLDVEKVLSELNPQTEEQDVVFQTLTPIEMKEEGIVFFCDDSVVARKQIQRTLESCSIPFKQAINGKEAWELIQKIVETGSDHQDHPLKIKMILTDIEMPEMDGYALTKLIKNHPKTKNIPVVMHSSLSSNQNQALGTSLGAEYYIPKFKPEELAKVFRHFLAKD